MRDTRVIHEKNPKKRKTKKRKNIKRREIECPSGRILKNIKSNIEIPIITKKIKTAIDCLLQQTCRSACSPWSFWLPRSMSIYTSYTPM